MSRVRRTAVRALKRLRAGLDLHVAEVTHYHPIARVPPPENPIWRERSPLTGGACDLGSQLELLESLAPAIDEFAAEELAPEFAGSKAVPAAFWIRRRA